MTDTYVIRGRKQAWDKFSQYIYDVYADTAEGFADFFKDHLGDVSPASTVEVADLKATLRLRMDGSWETIATTGETEDGTDPAQAQGLLGNREAVTSLLERFTGDSSIGQKLDAIYGPQHKKDSAKGHGRSKR